jgi:hypothetical protein
MNQRTGAFVVSISLLMCACKSSTQPATLPGGQTGTVTATIDGTPFTATSVQGTEGGGVVAIQGLGTLSGTTSIISLVIPSAEGTYPLGPTPGSNGRQSVTLSVGSGTLWTSDITLGSGSLTLSALNATGAAGTYTANLAPLLFTGATGTRNVVSGVFDVKF